MSVQNEEELRNVWAAGWEACPSLLTGWGWGGSASGWAGGCGEKGEGLVLNVCADRGESDSAGDPSELFLRDTAHQLR